MATAIHEGVPVLTSVPIPVIRETSLVAGFGIGANVFSVFVSGFRAPLAATGLGLLALLFTTIGVRSALRKAEGASKRLFWWSFLPPTILFSWTVFGVIFAAPAGAIAWIALEPLVVGVRREPTHHREGIALWLAIAGLLTTHACVPIVTAMILAYVLWATRDGWHRRFGIAVAIATLATLAAIAMPYLMWL